MSQLEGFCFSFFHCKIRGPTPLNKGDLLSALTQRKSGGKQKGREPRKPCLGTINASIDAQRASDTEGH